MPNAPLVPLSESDFQSAMRADGLTDATIYNYTLHARRIQQLIGPSYDYAKLERYMTSRSKSSGYVALCSWRAYCRAASAAGHSIPEFQPGQAVSNREISALGALGLPPGLICYMRWRHVRILDGWKAEYSTGIENAASHALPWVVLAAAGDTNPDSPVTRASPAEVERANKQAKRGMLPVLFREPSDEAVYQGLLRHCVLPPPPPAVELVAPSQPAPVAHNESVEPSPIRVSRPFSPPPSFPKNRE